MKIATLGPRGTCSEEVCLAYARQRGLAPSDVDLCPTFEAAIDRVNRGEADEAVVPAAYRAYNELVFSNVGQLRVREILYSKTPAFVLAARGRIPLLRDGSPYRVACHASPSPLLKQLDFATERVDVTSNAVAAQMAVVGAVDMCITNRHALEVVNAAAPIASRLEVVQFFGSVDMVWAVFERGASQGRKFWMGDFEQGPSIHPAAIQAWLAAEGLEARPADTLNEAIRIDLETPEVPGGSSRRPVALFVDNEPDAFQLIPETFPTWEWRYTASVDEARVAVRDPDIGVALVDIGLIDNDETDHSGARLLADFQQLAPGLPVMMITGYRRDAEIATACFRLGASDYLRKPLDVPRLQAWLGLLAQRWQARRHNTGCVVRTQQ